MSECQGCGEQPAVIEGLCIECVRAELCCPNQYAAARALCDCGGWAAEALRSLKESA